MMKYIDDVNVVDVQGMTLNNALKQYHVLTEKWIIAPNEMMNDWERCQRLWKNFKVDLKHMQADERRRAARVDRLTCKVGEDGVDVDIADPAERVAL